MSRGEIKQVCVAPNIELLRNFFGSTRYLPEIRNPHVESLVANSVKENARASAVLIPITNEPSPKLLLTKRQQNIRFAGHMCFPGGHVDDTDGSVAETALRESEEEIGLSSSEVEVLGELGIYYSQAGYKITPVVGIVNAGATLIANPDEVAAIEKVSLDRAFNSQNYHLTWHHKERAHYSFTEGDVRVAGPTVSIMIGLLEALADFSL